MDAAAPGGDLHESPGPAGKILRDERPQRDRPQHPVAMEQVPPESCFPPPGRKNGSGEYGRKDGWPGPGCRARGSGLGQGEAPKLGHRGKPRSVHDYKNKN